MMKGNARMPVIKKSVSFDPRIAAEIQNRGGEFATQINRMIDRYLEAIRRIDLRKILTPDEIAHLLNITKGIDFSMPMAINYLGDVIASSKPGNQELDINALAEKVNAMTYIEKLAIIDTSERFLFHLQKGDPKE
jgi:hypothetical protein